MSWENNLADNLAYVNVGATIYTAEMAPPSWRGTLNTLFQLATISGIVIAGAINLGTGEALRFQRSASAKSPPDGCNKQQSAVLGRS